MKTIGVLALQGCVTPHRAHIEALGMKYLEVRTEKDLDQIDALIIPGGESSVMLKLIDTFSLTKKLEETFERIPVWGICAGAILIAKSVSNPAQKSFGLIDMNVERNSYGRQLDSFNEIVDGCEVSFIRAPKIAETSKNVSVLARFDQNPTWVKQEKYMATTFHPELSSKTPSLLHREFAKLL